MQAALNQSTVQEEIVFLWQLRRRALLLDEGFQRQVLNVVKQGGCANGILNIEEFGILNAKRTLSSSSAPQRSTSQDSMTNLINSKLSAAMRTNSSSTTASSPVTRQPIFRTASAFAASSAAVSANFVLFSNSLFPPKQANKTNTRSLVSTDAEMMQAFLTNSDARASGIVHDGTTASCEVACRFEDGSLVATVEVVSAPVKTISRMQDKLLEYATEGSQWPLSAYILDPVRASVVCSGPSQMLEVLRWFVEIGPGHANCQTGLVACRVKNKFAVPAEELHRGYRDIMVLMVYTDPSSKLRIIGEVQIQDKVLYEYKLKVRDTLISLSEVKICSVLFSATPWKKCEIVVILSSET